MARIRAVLVALALALAGLGGLSTPSAAADPGLPFCTRGGPVPCFCPDRGGQVRIKKWQTCYLVQYGPWGDDEQQP